MRATWICCALCLYGCDVVWRLDDLRSGTTTDAMNASCEANPHDEDNDRIPDDCDPCPGIAGGDVDTDHDGVGDLCDPSDSVAHTRALFVSFAENPIRWSGVSGTWNPDGESIRYESTMLDSYGSTLRDGTLPEPPYVVEAHFSINSLAAYGALQIGFDANASGDAMTCGFVRRTGPTDVIHASNPNGAPAGETASAPLSTGDYRMKITYDRADAIHCTISGDGGTGGGTAMVAVANHSLPTGQLVLRSLRVGATFHYVAIYKAL